MSLPTVIVGYCECGLSVEMGVILSVCGNGDVNVTVNSWVQHVSVMRVSMRLTKVENRKRSFSGCAVSAVMRRTA